MAKRKKYPRLPNGYGQIRYLGKRRRNPYGVYPPSEEEYDKDKKILLPCAMCQTTCPDLRSSPLTMPNLQAG